MRQEKRNYCLCSILQYTLLYENIKISQEEIAKNLTPAKKGFEADNSKIKNFMKKQGFNYEFYWWNQTPFNEPDILLKEISKHQGFIALGNHAYRIINFQDPLILISDPKDERMNKKNLYNLMREFTELDGGFGLIKKIN